MNGFIEVKALSDWNRVKLKMDMTQANVHRFLWCVRYSERR